MAGGSDSGGSPGTLNPAALGVAATTLISVVGGLTLSGTVGRVLRNEPEPMAWALTAVLLGAALLAAAGLPATGKPTEVVFSILGLELILAGLVIAAVTGIGSASKIERPEVSAQLVDGGRRLTGTVAAGNLTADARFVTIVQGVAHGGQPATLERADIGPDGDGKVELPIDMRVPAGLYDELRIAAWSDDRLESEEGPAKTPCDELSRATDVVTGCLSLPLPPVPAGPSVEAGWMGEKGESDRIEVRVTAANAATRLTQKDSIARLAVVVKRRRGKRDYLPIYRGLFRPDADGKVDSKFQVPVGPKGKRVCVGAAFEDTEDDRPIQTIACKRKEGESKRLAQTVVHLRRP
jgi:hypothetical protein